MGTNDNLNEIRGCQCEECIKARNLGLKPHCSDCAVHNEPAEPKGLCNCRRYALYVEGSKGKIFTIAPDGTIELRGEVIGVDKELAEILNSQRFVF